MNEISSLPDGNDADFEVVAAVACAAVHVRNQRMMLAVWTL